MAGRGKGHVSHANFEIVSSTTEHVVIRDLGPWDRHPTITNDAAWVVQQLIDETLPGPDDQHRKLLYYDSQGDLDEIVIQEGKFSGFFRPVGAEGVMATLMDQPPKNVCTRCGRALKSVHVVEGHAYGPICVVKLYGAQPAKMSSAPRRKHVEQEDNTQLPFFEEDLSS